VRSQELGIDNISTRTGNLWIALSLKAFPLKGILKLWTSRVGLGACVIKCVFDIVVYDVF
jgi:hypothetical protein